MVKSNVPLLVCLMAALAPSRPDAAQHAPRSLYTSVELESCQLLPASDTRSAWTCRGLPGYPIYIAVEASRYFLSVGSEPEKRRAATQTLPPANTPFDGKSNRITIEWRFYESIERQQVPYATIVRFFTTDAARRGEVLIVSRVGAEETCHMAYIDATASPDAIAIARTIADEKSRTFDCSRPPERPGRRGRRP